MSPKSLSKLVDAYIERYSKQRQWSSDLVMQEIDVNFWAWEELERLVNEEPESAWAAILAVLSSTTDTHTLDALSAGPLEYLIDLHGKQFIERIEIFARTDPKFKALLGGVWQSSTADVWERVVRAQTT